MSQSLLELREYLADTHRMFRALKTLAESRSKTKKVKACITTCQIFLVRLNATIEAAKASGSDPLGGLSIGGVTIQKSIYEDVLEYWKGILK